MSRLKEIRDEAREEAKRQNAWLKHSTDLQKQLLTETQRQTQLLIKAPSALPEFVARV